MTLYGRRVEVTIADFVIRDLKIAFDLERQPDEMTPHGEIAIYNLSEESEDRIHERGATVRIDAGYPQTFATLFDGAVTRVVRERQGTERVTRVEVGGLATSQPRIGGITSRSYRDETIRRIVRDLAQDLDMPIGPLDAIPPVARVRTWVWHGPTLAGIVSILRRVNVAVYEDDGVLRFGDRTAPQPDAPRIALSRQNGLVGRPAITDDGAEAVSLLNPLMRVGGLIDIESSAVNGLWRIVGVRHRGDNWDGQFLSAVDLRAAS